MAKQKQDEALRALLAHTPPHQRDTVLKDWLRAHGAVAAAEPPNTDEGSGGDWLTHFDSGQAA